MNKLYFSLHLKLEDSCLCQPQDEVQRIQLLHLVTRDDSQLGRHTTAKAATGKCTQVFALFWFKQRSSIQ